MLGERGPALTLDKMEIRRSEPPEPTVTGSRDGRIFLACMICGVRGAWDLLTFARWIRRGAWFALYIPLIIAIEAFHSL
jgi:hypothetical protein